MSLINKLLSLIIIIFILVLLLCSNESYTIKPDNLKRCEFIKTSADIDMAENIFSPKPITLSNGQKINLKPLSKCGVCTDGSQYSALITTEYGRYLECERDLYREYTNPNTFDDNWNKTYLSNMDNYKKALITYIYNPTNILFPSPIYGNTNCAKFVKNKYV